jgi:protein-tyrosine phosphatase
MRHIAGRKLWIGNAGDLRDPAAILALEVAAVVELADSEPAAALPRDLVRHRFPISDGGDNPPWLLRLAIEAIASLLRADIPVFVGCSAGMSRSVAVVACALAIVETRPPAEMLRLVAAGGPADVSPALWEQLQRVLAAPAG